MATYSDFVLDDYKRPIPGAKVELYSEDGLSLINTTTTNALGAFTVTGPDAKSLLVVSYGGASARSMIIVGDPPEYVGPTGLAANTFASVAALTAAPTAQFKSATLAGAAGVPDGVFTYQTAGAPYTADGVNTIPADVALSVGAWVRQNAGSIATKAPGASAIAETSQAWMDRVGIWPEQFGSRVGGFDDARLIAACNALQNGGALYIAQDFTMSTGVMQLLNRTNVRIYGPGRLILDGGAPDECIMLRLVGTCDNVTIQGVRFAGPGRGDATARQYGVGNNSGQTLSRVWVDSCAFEDLNIGVGFSAESGGSYKNALATRNVLKRLKGGLGGQGYGIFASGATDVTIALNQIEYAERHSIYVSKLADASGANAAVLVDSNIIRNHRQTIQGNITRPAIFMGRGYGGKVSNNTIVNFWDGAFGTGHDTGDEVTPIRQNGDIEFIGNTIIGRQNVIASVQIGEPLVPTTATTQRVDIKRNKFQTDYAVAPSQFEIEIYNGKTINVLDNDFYLANVPNGTGLRLIGIGTIANVGDVAGVHIERNKVDGTAVTPSTVNFSFTRLPAAHCGGTARIVVDANVNDTGFTSQNVEYDAARTNPNILDRIPGQTLIGAYTAADTTPSVAGGVELIVLANAAATNITDFTGGITGQKLMVKFADGNSTLKLNANMRLPADIVGSIYRTVQLVKSSGGPWHPVSDITGS